MVTVHPLLSFSFSKYEYFMSVSHLKVHVTAALAQIGFEMSLIFIGFCVCLKSTAGGVLLIDTDNDSRNKVTNARKISPRTQAITNANTALFTVLEELIFSF